MPRALMPRRGAAALQAQNAKRNRRGRKLALKAAVRYMRRGNIAKNRVRRVEMPVLTAPVFGTINWKSGALIAILARAAFVDRALTRAAPLSTIPALSYNLKLSAAHGACWPAIAGSARGEAWACHARKRFDAWKNRRRHHRRGNKND